MPPVNPVPPKAKKAKPTKVRVTVPDAGEATRTQRPTPPTEKVRMYAHPYREQPQKVMRQQVAEQKQEAAHAKRLAKTVAKIHVTPVASPDATDSLRTPAQKQHDAQVVAQTVKAERLKVVREQGRGSGTRAVKAWAKSNIADAKKFATTDSSGHHVSSPFAMIVANTPGPGGVSVKVLKNAGKDAAELAVTTPSSIAKLGSDIVHHPRKVPGELVKPYVDLAKHPVKNVTEKPVTTALELQPIVKVPGRVVGRVARVAGKQTLERAPATLPGTALEDARVGSRDAAVRRNQAKKDAARPTPTMTPKQVQQRVDAHFDHAKHESHRIVGEHVQAAKQATKGQPKPVQQAAVDAAREHGRQVADELAQERFAREFGANERLSHGVVAREATHTARRRAVKVLDATKAAAKQAEDTHKAAWNDLRAARNAARSSPHLRALEFTRRDTQRNLMDAQRAHATARAEHAKAVGRAQILTRNVTGRETPTRLSYTAETPPVPGMVRLYRGSSKYSESGQGGAREGRWFTPDIAKARRYGDDLSYVDVPRAVADASTAKNFLGTSRGEHILPDEWAKKAAPVPKATATHYAGGEHGVRTAQQAKDAAAKAVQDARVRLRDLDRRIADEHARPLPPLHPARQAFTQAIKVRGAARVALAQARADAHVAAHAHIAAKKAMTNSTLVSPASTGRLFAHKADAATVVKKLNTAAAATGAAEPATFVLRQVGPDRWAAVPKVAAARLLKHQVVGTSPATMAKVMRVSRGAFTNAVLPLSAKWLAGQGIEAGVRSAVAGAGPLDWLRMGKVVKKLNAQRPGAGDELATRITGGQFDLTGPARDFANGKSLADEFEGTSLSRPARAATAAGQALPAKAVRQGWGHYTRAVLGGINHVIEQNARRAMAGQAIKNLGFDEKHINGLSDKAITDAANGLKGTHNQVALTRAVNSMYGKYQGFSPEMRSLLLHWTPFAPWYLNTAKFLLKTLPYDHPVKAALVADASAVEKDWRESHGLSINGPHVPDFLLGSYPIGEGKSLPLAHYTPFGIGTNVTGSAADLMLPQFLGPLKNAGGVDWKWDPLTHGGSHGQKFTQGERLTRAFVTALEEQVPGVSQAGKISGITPRYVDKNSPDTIKSAGSVLKGYLPTTPTASGSVGSGSASSSSPVRVRVKAPRPPRPPRPARPSR